MSYSNAKMAEYMRGWRLKHPGKVKASVRRWALKNPEKIREAVLVRKYGLTLAQLDAITEFQDGLCAICDRKPNGTWKALHIDHCHKSGRVRGLICHSCNALLGLAKDNAETLRRAAEYLENQQIS